MEINGILYNLIHANIEAIKYYLTGKTGSPWGVFLTPAESFRLWLHWWGLSCPTKNVEPSKILKLKKSDLNK